MITCTCALRGPETCPRHRAYEQRSMTGLDPLTARALAAPQPLGIIPADVLTDLVEANARLLASDD